jgi:hypothetical protein
MKILILNYWDDATNQIQQIREQTRDYATVTIKTRLPLTQMAACLKEVQPNIVQFISQSLRNCRFRVTNDQGKDDAVDYDGIMEPFQEYLKSSGRKIDLIYIATELSCVMGSRFYHLGLAKISLSFGLWTSGHPDGYARVSQCLYAGIKTGLTRRNIREILTTGLDKTIRKECYLFCSINKLTFHELS